MRFFLVLLLSVTSVLAYTANDGAKTILSDGSVLDTDAAITYVKGKAEDGWVLTVGGAGGTYTWLAADLYALGVDVPYNFTMQGASPTNRPSIGGDNALAIAITDGKLITVKDMIFSSARNDYFLYVNGISEVPGFRVTNCKFIFNSPGSPARLGVIGGTVVGPGPYGLFDHCEFYGTGTGFYIFQNSDDTTTAWDRPVEFGTEKSVYFEDCWFHSDTFVPVGGPLIDSWRGGGYVFRHNIVDNRAIGDHGTDHASNFILGVLKHEVMHNTFIVSADDVSTDNLVFFRGGTGVIFDNDFNITGADSSANNAIWWHYYRANYVAGSSNSLFDRFYTALNTTIASGSNGASLPQATIHVADTTALSEDDFTNPNVTIDNLKVTTVAGVQTVTCTGKTDTSFTGCSGGTGAMSTGGAVTRASDYLGTQQPGSGPILTRLTAGSNGVTLPQGTLHVEDTSLFPASGNLIVNAESGIAYTGKTSTTLTGCTGGAGTLATGQLVGQVGQDPRYPAKPWGSIPIFQWSNRVSGGIAISHTSGGDGFIVTNRDWYNYDSSDKPGSTGTWVDSYVEYPYPHRLNSGAAPETGGSTNIAGAGTTTMAGAGETIVMP